MKRLIMMLMAFCLIVPMANAELTKKQEKAISKMAKDHAKQLEKDGYSIMDSLSLRNALEKHLTLLEEGATEQIGIGHSNSVNDGRKNCLTYAIAGYASKEQLQFNDRSVKDVYGNEICFANDLDFARFYAEYERFLQKEVQGVLIESFTVSRQLPDGSYDFIMYFTVDEAKAKFRQQKALNEAISESDLSHGYAK